LKKDKDGKTRREIDWSLEELKRHLDGRNSKRDGFTHTAVFSVLVQVGDEVYRLSFIAYSRESCLEWIDKETKITRPIWNKGEEYHNSSSGGIKYELYHFSESNDHLVVTTTRDGNNANTKIWKNPDMTNEECGLDPAVDYPTPHTIDSDGTKSEAEHTPMKWKEQPIGKNIGLKYINFAESVCRYARNSCQAWAINLLSDVLQLSKRCKQQLNIIAMRSSSQHTFVGDSYMNLVPGIFLASGTGLAGDTPEFIISQPVLTVNQVVGNDEKYIYH